MAVTRTFSIIKPDATRRNLTGAVTKMLAGFPIYDQSESCPGAFVVTCHSGVTLAANHALTLAPAILAGELPDSVKLAFYLGAIAFLGAVVWTVVRTEPAQPGQA